MTISGWQLRRLSGPAAEPLTLAQAKAQCRVDADIVEDDEWFTDAIREARAFIEDQLKSTLVETSYRYERGQWGWDSSSMWVGPELCDTIALPFGPIIAIDAITYLDTDGTRQDLAADRFQLVKTGTSGHVVPAYRTSWPAARASAGSIAIDYRAGYESEGSPAGPGGVPPPVVRGMKMLVAHWYQNRESVLVGTISKEMEQGLNAVIGAYRNLP